MCTEQAEAARTTYGWRQQPGKRRGRRGPPAQTRGLHRGAPSRGARQARSRSSRQHRAHRRERVWSHRM